MSLNGSPKWMYNAGSNFYPYLINQSLRFNSADSAYLSRTPSSASNRKTFTLSCWVKRGNVGEQTILDAYSNDQNRTRLMIDAGNRFQVFTRLSNSDHSLICNAISRDNSAWYNVVYSIDTTQSTASDRVKIYINGESQTFTGSSFPDQNEDMFINSNVGHSIGSANDSGGRETFFDGYLAEMHLVDGSALTASSFGETKENIWIAKEYTGSHGTNGFYLKYVAGAEGTDSSGNGNNFTHTPGNTSRNRPVQDSPTNNFCLIPYSNNSSLLVKEHQGMRLNTSRTGYWDGAYGNFAVKSGKWYYEVQMNETAGDNFRTVPGWQNAPEERPKVYNRLGTSGDPFGTSSSDDLGNSGHYAFPPWNATFFGNGGYTGTKSAASKGDVLNVAVDFDNNKIYFGLNGTYLANDGGTDGDPANGTNESLSGLLDNGKFYSPSVSLRNDSSAGSNSVRFNFGHDRSFGANLSLGTAYADENGFGEFRYSVPSGFLALCSQNLPAPAVDPNNEANPTDFFNTLLYTGDGADDRSISGVGFQPNFTWIKQRSATRGHLLVDSVRGATQRIRSNNSIAEDTFADGVQAFESDGFQVGTNNTVNVSSGTYVAWNWLAGGSASSNSNGSITSSVSANTDAGFSIVSYTGNGGSSATVGHGLTTAPDVIWLKNRSAGEGWVSFYDTPTMGPTKFVTFNSTGAAATSSGEWNNTAPTNTVFTIGNQGRVNTNTHNYIAYCFHNVDGYSRVGSYEGNSNADGPTINCGFRPAFIIFKNSEFAELWVIFDNKRDVGNLVDLPLYPNLTNSESAASSRGVDFLSSGFKIRGTDTSVNRTGDSHLYVAFADQPFKYANGK